MVYVCSICGHVYDEAKEKVPFAQLPDDWTCPSCGAEKAMFDPVTDDDAGQEKVVEAEAHKLEKLPSAILATIFSNFERACRKQYDEESAKLFHELSLALAPAAGKGTPDDLAAMVDEDISTVYPALKSLCAGKKDRGALRALTWGEKVTRIHRSLLSQLKRQGASFAEGTSVWLCTACGFVFIGDEAPQRCPVCKVPQWLFEEIGGGEA